MSDETPTPDPVEPTAPALSAEEAARRAALPETARRALEEADLRKAKEAAAKMPVELGGREGPEPVRYGDWEKKGIAIDF
ncbi:DUF1674 domain-containing protein [Dinoroseobacter sp. S76]|uniref:DUF1674 domain-containing protein n=1 Tax=Dinoroseobacter sp. S76 TaxID=3415124 RepID=UPI003C7CF489